MASDRTPLNPQTALDLMDRWQRMEMHVRCGLSPEHPGCVRIYLLAGLKVVRRGLRPAADIHHRMLHTLLRCVADESLPWFWRSVCLENVNLPLAKLTSLLGGAESLMAADLNARVEAAREALPVTP